MTHEKDRPMIPDDLDPVVEEATKFALEQTKPPKHHGWIDLTVYILLSISLVFSSGAAVVSVANSIKIEHEQSCQASINMTLREIADSDRKAYDDLFKAVLGTPGLTRAGLDQAYQRYRDQRAENDRERAQAHLKPNGKC